MSDDSRAAEATVRAQRAEIERMRRADELAAGAREGELRRMGARLEEARPTGTRGIAGGDLCLSRSGWGPRIDRSRYVAAAANAGE